MSGTCTSSRISRNALPLTGSLSAVGSWRATPSPSFTPPMYLLSGMGLKERYLGNDLSLLLGGNRAGPSVVNKAIPAANWGG